MVYQTHNEKSVGRLIRYAVATALMVGGFASCDQKSGVNPGELVPDFHLQNLQGEDFERDDLKGTGTVLSFWASWCEPCLRELPALERLNAMLQKKGGRVVSIGIDDSAVNLRKAAEKAGVTFDILVDDKGVAKRRYQVKGVPETFLLSKDAEIQALVSDKGKVEVRLRGPREWDSAETVSLLEATMGLN